MLEYSGTANDEINICLLHSVTLIVVFAVRRKDKVVCVSQNLRQWDFLCTLWPQMRVQKLCKRKISDQILYLWPYNEEGLLCAQVEGQFHKASIYSESKVVSWHRGSLVEPHQDTIRSRCSEANLKMVGGLTSSTAGTKNGLDSETWKKHYWVNVWICKIVLQNCMHWWRVVCNFKNVMFLKTHTLMYYKTHYFMHHVNIHAYTSW